MTSQVQHSRCNSHIILCLLVCLHHQVKFTPDHVSRAFGQTFGPRDAAEGSKYRRDLYKTKWYILKQANAHAH